MPSNSKQKQSPYVGYFRGNGTRTASRLFEPNSHPHVGVYRHAPARTTSHGLQAILLDKKTSLKPKSVISTLQLFSGDSLPRHVEKKTLESMPSSHFHSNCRSCDDIPMCPICLENFVDGDEIRNLKCSHCFHKSCIDIWLLGTLSTEVTTTVCPTCRQDASVAILEPESGRGVYTSPNDCTDPTPTIPAECFLRIGQFLLHEGSKASDSNTTNTLSRTEDATPKLSPPLPPIAVTKSPPLPPLPSMTTHVSEADSSHSPGPAYNSEHSPTAAFLVDRNIADNQTDCSRTSSSSISSESSGYIEASTILFSALRDDSPSDIGPEIASSCELYVDFEDSDYSQDLNQSFVNVASLNKMNVKQ